MMLQLDGSPHHWFGGEEEYCLMNLIDDATGKSYALMSEAEDTQTAMRVLKGWIERYGIPQSIYVDLHTIYGARTGQVTSVFKEACEALGIEVIPAYSPQAKGRVERSHKTYQDRLVKEIRLRKLKSAEEVNGYLEKEFLADYNGRFGKEPLLPEDGHVPILEVDLDEIFVWKEERVVQKDYTVRFKNKVYQIERPVPASVVAKKKIQVKIHLDGRITMNYQGEKIHVKELLMELSREKKEELKCPEKPIQQRAVSPIKRGLNSPWRRFYPGGYFGARVSSGALAPLKKLETELQRGHF